MPTDIRGRDTFVDSRVQQGMSLRSKTNYGNTHMMVSYPSRVNISLPKLVKDGLSYTEAKKRIARAVRCVDSIAFAVLMLRAAHDESFILYVVLSVMYLVDN